MQGRKPSVNTFNRELHQKIPHVPSRLMQQVVSIAQRFILHVNKIITTKFY